MFLNVEELQHIRFSQTRLWMTLIMGATMSIVMLAFMRGMYKRRGVNVADILGSLAAFGASLWLVRSQETVGYVAYMKAMIPHHSIAVLTSERAEIKDPRVRALADQIIESQRREIDEMNRLIADLRPKRDAEAHARAPTR